MAMCGIMRVEKRGRAAVYGLQLEANRTKEDHEQGRDFDRSDIDWELTDTNEHLIKTDNWNQEITRQIKEVGAKERKNSIVMLDGLYTASPEFFDDKTKEEARRYFEECLEFHVRHYCGGDRSRVINAVIHWDETTPHVQIASVPILESEKGFKLSARDIMGNRSDYRLRQDRFFEEVTKDKGLERGNLVEYDQDGITGILSRAEDAKVHTTKREWQIAVQAETIEKQQQAIRRNTHFQHHFWNDHQHFFYCGSDVFDHGRNLSALSGAWI